MNTPIVTQKTEIPETLAASEFPPTAYMFFPKVVLFQINHATIIAIIAGIISLGNVTSSPFIIPKTQRPPIKSFTEESIEPTGVPVVPKNKSP